MQALPVVVQKRKVTAAREGLGRVHIYHYSDLWYSVIGMRMKPCALHTIDVLMPPAAKHRW